MKRITKWGATKSHSPPTANASATASGGGAASSTGSTPAASQEELEGDDRRSNHSASSGPRQNGKDGFGGSGIIHSYKELEHLPCVVVLAGSHRAGLSFPR